METKCCNRYYPDMVSVVYDLHEIW